MAFRIVRQDDPGYTVSDGIMMGNRACLEIDRNCPERIAKAIQEAYTKGWIRQTITFTEEEYTWMMLQK
jgi:hypothetical protein